MAGWREGWVGDEAGSARDGSDHDQVVGEYPVPAPDRGFLPAVQPGAVPALAAFEVGLPRLDGLITLSVKAGQLQWHEQHDVVFPWYPIGLVPRPPGTGSGPSRGSMACLESGTWANCWMVGSMSRPAPVTTRTVWPLNVPSSL
jgi:hypothetical protein